MKGSKKLKDYFIDRKIPAGERNTVPLLSDKRRIIWIMDPGKCGYGIISEKVKVTGKTKRILQVKFAG
jgi:tRNA(Ile)-lysidine synthase